MFFSFFFGWVGGVNVKARRLIMILIRVPRHTQVVVRHIHAVAMKIYRFRGLFPVASH